jgi:hypothetical protein
MFCADPADKLTVEQLLSAASAADIPVSRSEESAASGETRKLPLTSLLGAAIISGMLWWGIIDAVRWLSRPL